jgi:hypothetical protein
VYYAFGFAANPQSTLFKALVAIHVVPDALRVSMQILNSIRHHANAKYIFSDGLNDNALHCIAHQ